MSYSFKKVTLTSKLLVATLLVSSIATLCITIVQLFIDYNKELKIVQQNIALARDGYKGPLAYALWDLNDVAIHQNLLGLSIIPGIGRAEIIVNSKVVHSTNGEIPKAFKIVEFPLIYERSATKSEDVGILRIYENMDLVYQKIKDRIVIIFISQLVKTFIVSILLLFVFRSIIVSRVIALEEFLRKFNLGKSKIALPVSDNRISRILNQDDEFNELERSIADLLQKIEVSFTQAEMLLEKVEISYKQAENFNKELAYKVKDATDTVIKQREVLEREAKLSSLGTLALQLGHEIDNPLLSIVGFVDIAIDKLATDPSADIKNDLQNVMIGAERIKKIIHSMRMIGRSNDEEPYKKHRLFPIVDDVLILLSNKIRHSGIVINIEGRGLDPQVIGNNVHLMQIFMNLLSNAIDAVATQENRLVKLAVINEVDSLRVDIVDNGPGISEFGMEKIWEPFYTTKEAGKGSGLGLSIVKSLVTRHEGRIEYFREENHSVFRINFPLPVG